LLLSRPRPNLPSPDRVYYLFRAAPLPHTARTATPRVACCTLDLFIRRIFLLESSLIDPGHQAHDGRSLDARPRGVKWFNPTTCGFFSFNVVSSVLPPLRSPPLGQASGTAVLCADRTSSREGPALLDCSISHKPGLGRTVHSYSCCVLWIDYAAPANASAQYATLSRLLL